LQSDVIGWGMAMAEHAGAPPFTFEDIAPAMARSFWYEGLAYEPPYTISAQPETTARLARNCKKRYGARGVVRGRNAALSSPGLAISSFENAIGDNGPEWAMASPAKLPSPFRRYRARLAKLANSHWLVVSHWHTEDERADLWNLYLLERGGDRRIAGVARRAARAAARDRCVERRP
jgi:hypothetical protein